MGFIGKLTNKQQRKCLPPHKYVATDDMIKTID